MILLVIATQVHDELVLEVDSTVVKEAAFLLQKCMESAAMLLGTSSSRCLIFLLVWELFSLCFILLSVPLHVKLKVGRTWGSLEPIQADKCADIVPGL